MQTLRRLFFCLTLPFVVAGCSGGSSESSQENNSGAPGISGAPDNTGTPVTVVTNPTQAVNALPTVNGQPNTVSPSLRVGANGQQHTVYSDIDGQVIYATCSTQCGEGSSRWNRVVIFNAEINPLIGYAVPKLQIDANGTMHVAVVVNLDGGVVFATQTTHYFQCQSNCLSANSWRGEQVHTHSDGHLEADLNNVHWFDLTSQGAPRLAFIETTPGLFGDEFLFLIACNQNCTSASNWGVQTITDLNLASKRPATVRTTQTGEVHLVYEYGIIAGDRSELQYINCTFNCDSANAQWSSPTIIQALNREDFNYNAYATDLIGDSAPFVAVLSNTDGVFDVRTSTCVSQCTQSSNWITVSILPNIDLPANTTVAGRSIDISFDRGALDIALFTKQSSIGVPTSLARISCTSNCFEGTWSYEELLSSAGIDFENVGICQFVATGLSGPITLLPTAATAVMVPHWACGTSPVEVTDLDGNVFIDYSSDVRFFEIASVGQVF